MKHPFLIYISLTAMLLLASFTTAATTTTFQVPLAGTVVIPLNDGTSEAVNLAGRVHVTAKTIPSKPSRFTFALNQVSGSGDFTGLRYTATGTNRLILPVDPIAPIDLTFVLRVRPKPDEEHTNEQGAIPTDPIYPLDISFHLAFHPDTGALTGVDVSSMSVPGSD